MPIKLQTPKGSISVSFDQQYDEKVRKVFINVLEYVGEQCVIEARENGNYKDQTGNLRCSISYAIVEDGKIIKHGLPAQYKQGKKGADTAKKYLEEVGKRFSGTSLIVVAGMNYAAYVERNGYNVLTSAELLADELVPKLLKQLGFTTK